MKHTGLIYVAFMEKLGVDIEYVHFQNCYRRVGFFVVVGFVRVMNNASININHQRCCIYAVQACFLRTVRKYDDGKMFTNV